MNRNYWDLSVYKPKERKQRPFSERNRSCFKRLIFLYLFIIVLITPFLIIHLFLLLGAVLCGVKYKGMERSNLWFSFLEQECKDEALKQERLARGKEIVTCELVCGIFGRLPRFFKSYYDFWKHIDGTDDELKIWALKASEDFENLFGRSAKMIHRDVVLSHDSMPKFSQIRHSSPLFSDEVSLFVSHKWIGEKPDDENNGKWLFLKEFLQSHPDISYLWIDYCCVDQDNFNLGEVVKAMERIRDWDTLQIKVRGYEESAWCTLESGFIETISIHGNYYVNRPDVYTVLQLIYSNKEWSKNERVSFVNNLRMRDVL